MAVVRFVVVTGVFAAKMKDEEGNVEDEGVFIREC
jgi:hypothetical protein